LGWEDARLGRLSRTAGSSPAVQELRSFPAALHLFLAGALEHPAWGLPLDSRVGQTGLL